MKSLREYILESVQSDSKSDGVTPDDITKLNFYKVSNYNELKKIIKDSGTNIAEKKGFWLFLEALKKDENAYGNINKEPWYINYIKCEATYTKDNKKNKNICGLISYSLKYWDDDNNKPIDGNIMHIFDIQTISTFKGLLSEYFKKLEEIAESNNCKALTLQRYTDSLKDVYEKHGFKPVDGQNNLMIKKI